MKFKSINESDKFDYRDCVITEFAYGENMLTLTLDALIVRANNSQNSNYTDSYAGDARAVFENATIKKIVRLGCRRYDANDVLIEDVPDEIMDINNVDMKGSFEGAFLPELEKKSDGEYVLVAEIAKEAYEIPEEYEICINCDNIIIEWDRYLNRVQNI